ncbi:hypothetical protein ACFYKX_11410 [Cytobacillus sp. FJAT-54145]|uniref:Uncharacterized protein n=1 Tax=Cytobacillus spartinae TaxID=3299023 RepID=A0ABW6KAG4_9BACI
MMTIQLPLTLSDLHVKESISSHPDAKGNDIIDGITWEVSAKTNLDVRKEVLWQYVKNTEMFDHFKKKLIGHCLKNRDALDGLIPQIAKGGRNRFRTVVMSWAPEFEGTHYLQHISSTENHITFRVTLCYPKTDTQHWLNSFNYLTNKNVEIR